MIKLRRSAERGHFNHGWLETFHTFSFGRYYDPSHMGFHGLRVINEDWIRAGAGFGTHGHEDMEILTYVLEGELAHRDSLGHSAVLPPGEFQRMTAGTGIEHSEFNPSSEHPVHLYQIWILPDQENRAPEYEQRRFPADLSEGHFGLIGSPESAEGGLNLHADVRIYHARLRAGSTAQQTIGSGRHGWLQILRGSIALAGDRLSAGDAAALTEIDLIDLESIEDSELLLFDLG
jgi:quercetin 2,3-dioxygenase